MNTIAPSGASPPPAAKMTNYTINVVRFRVGRPRLALLLCRALQ
jgi:hypothetical protein